MKKFFFINFVTILLFITQLSAQYSLYKPEVINTFCQNYAEGMSKTELQLDRLFFDQYKCVDLATGNIFGTGSLDAAAIFEETLTDNGHRFGVVFRGNESSKLYPEAFTFDLFSSIESGTSGGSYFLIEDGYPLTLVNSTGSRMGQIFTYEYEYNHDWGRLELIREIWDEYDKLSPEEGEQKITTYEYWERPSLRTCLDEQFISEEQFNSVTKLKETYQDCLDQGQNMLGCSQDYYEQVDGLLNVEYKALRKLLSTSQKSELKNKQLAWLTKRDNHFDEIEYNVTYSGMGGNDAQMIVWDEKAAFVLEKVIELMESQTKLSN